MIEVIFILFCALCLLVLLETAFCDLDVPEDVVRRRK
jgi:hypothetical protein